MAKTYHTFSVEFEGDLDSLLGRAQAIAVFRGGILKGDTKGGVFAGGGVTGRYSVSGHVVNIEIISFDYPANATLDHDSLERAVRRFFEAGGLEDDDQRKGAEVFAWG